MIKETEFFDDGRIKTIEVTTYVDTSEYDMCDENKTDLTSKIKIDKAIEVCDDDIFLRERIEISRADFLDAITLDDIASFFFVAEHSLRMGNKVEYKRERIRLEVIAMDIQELIKEYKELLKEL